MIAYMEFEEIEALTNDTMHMPFYEALAHVGVENTDYERVFSNIRLYLIEGEESFIHKAIVEHAYAQDVEY